MSRSGFAPGWMYRMFGGGGDGSSVPKSVSGKRALQLYLEKDPELKELRAAVTNERVRLVWDGEFKSKYGLSMASMNMENFDDKLYTIIRANIFHKAGIVDENVDILPAREESDYFKRFLEDSDVIPKALNGIMLVFVDAFTKEKIASTSYEDAYPDNPPQDHSRGGNPKEEESINNGDGSAEDLPFGTAEPLQWLFTAGSWTATGVSAVMMGGLKMTVAIVNVIPIPADKLFNIGLESTFVAGGIIAAGGGAPAVGYGVGMVLAFYGGGEILAIGVEQTDKKVRQLGYNTTGFKSGVATFFGGVSTIDSVLDVGRDAVVFVDPRQGKWQKLVSVTRLVNNWIVRPYLTGQYSIRVTYDPDELFTRKGIMSNRLLGAITNMWSVAKTRSTMKYIIEGGIEAFAANVLAMDIYGYASQMDSVDLKSVPSGDKWLPRGDLEVYPDVDPRTPAILRQLEANGETMYRTNTRMGMKTFSPAEGGDITQAARMVKKIGDIESLPFSKSYVASHTKAGADLWTQIKNPDTGAPGEDQKDPSEDISPHPLAKELAEKKERLAWVEREIDQLTRFGVLEDTVTELKIERIKLKGEIGNIVNGVYRPRAAKPKATPSDDTPSPPTPTPPPPPPPTTTSTPSTPQLVEYQPEDESSNPYTSKKAKKPDIISAAFGVIANNDNDIAEPGSMKILNEVDEAFANHSVSVVSKMIVFRDIVNTVMLSIQEFETPATQLLVPKSMEDDSIDLENRKRKRADEEVAAKAKADAEAQAKVEAEEAARQQRTKEEEERRRELWVEEHTERMRVWYKKGFDAKELANEKLLSQVSTDLNEFLKSSSWALFTSAQKRHSLEIYKSDFRKNINGAIGVAKDFFIPTGAAIKKGGGDVGEWLGQSSSDMLKYIKTLGSNSVMDNMPTSSAPRPIPSRMSLVPSVFKKSLVSQSFVDSIITYASLRVKQDVDSFKTALRINKVSAAVRVDIQGIADDIGGAYNALSAITQPRKSMRAALDSTSETVVKYVLAARKVLEGEIKAAEAKARARGDRSSDETLRSILEMNNRKMSKQDESTRTAKPQDSIGGGGGIKVDDFKVIPEKVVEMDIGEDNSAADPVIEPPIVDKKPEVVEDPIPEVVEDPIPEVAVEEVEEEPKIIVTVVDDLPDPANDLIEHGNTLDNSVIPSDEKEDDKKEDEKEDDKEEKEEKEDDDDDDPPPRKRQRHRGRIYIDEKKRREDRIEKESERLFSLRGFFPTAGTSVFDVQDSEPSRDLKERNLSMGMTPYNPLGVLDNKLAIGNFVREGFRYQNLDPVTTGEFFMGGSLCDGDRLYGTKRSVLMS